MYAWLIGYQRMFDVQTEISDINMGQGLRVHRRRTEIRNVNYASDMNKFSHNFSKSFSAKSLTRD